MLILTMYHDLINMDHIVGMHYDLVEPDHPNYDSCCIYADTIIDKKDIHIQVFTGTEKDCRTVLNRIGMEYEKGTKYINIWKIMKAARII